MRKRQVFWFASNCIVLFGLLVLGAWSPGLAQGAPAQSAPADAAPHSSVSPQELVSGDGTLRLDGTFSGSLDLQGWNVQMDAQRGPVFTPASAPVDRSATAVGQWSNLGSAVQALNNNVRAIAVNGTDVYMGGNFTDANGIPAADYIVKWDSVSGNWSALGSNGAGNGALSGVVNAIAVYGQYVYAGGMFLNVNNNGVVLNAADYIARWDTVASTWSALGSNGSNDGSIGSTVYAIAVDPNGRVYVGGAFTDVVYSNLTLTQADYLALWNGVNWAPVGNNGGSNGALNGAVYAIAIDGTNVYVGGTFYNVNNGGSTLSAADFIAMWDASSNVGSDHWSALGNDNLGNGALNAPVRALAVDGGGNLYAGGDFTDVKWGAATLTSADYIARWDGGFWSALGTGAGNGSLNGTVYAIAVNGTNVYVGGNFANVNNKGTPLGAADYVARFDTTTTNWSALGSDGANGGSLNATLYALAISGSTVYAGGAFRNVNSNGTPMSAGNFIASWNTGTGLWSAPAATNPMPALNMGVFAIAISGTNVYVGGTFQDVQNHTTAIPAADYVARWDSVSGNWSALANNGAGNGSLNSYVRAIAVDSAGVVYVGGDFTNVSNYGTAVPAADYIAKWDPVSGNWSALGSNGGPGDGSLNSGVYALAFMGSNLYVGGNFTDVNSNGTVRPTADYIARWDGTNWWPLLGNGGTQGSLIGTVYAIAISGTDVYVGGEFTNVNNGGLILPEADYIAKWDSVGQSWSKLGSNGGGDGALNGKVWAIAVTGPNVYVGGVFTNASNVGAADYMAKWDSTSGTWSGLGHDLVGNGALNGYVRSIVIVGSAVYVAGDFTDVINANTPVPAADYVAKWDSGSGAWSALGSNGAGNGALTGSPSVLVTGGNSMYLGGYLTSVSNNGTLLTAAGPIARYTLPSNNADLSNLVVSSGTMSPVFAAATTVYTVAVASSTSAITATPTVADPDATVKVNGTTVVSGNPSGAIPLNVGGNTITTVVTASDGTTTKTYTLTVTRATPAIQLFLPMIVRNP